MNRFILFLSISLIFLSGCKSTQPATGASKVSKSGLSDSQKADVSYIFFNANKEKILGNLNIAADLFAEVIRKDGSNAAAMYELANIYSEQKKFSDALFFSKSAWMIDSKNIWYALSYADILNKNRKHSEAAVVLGQLVKDYPDRYDFYYEWAAAYVYDEKFSEAIKVYDKLEERMGMNSDLTMRKSRLYQRINKNDKAIAELRKLIDSNPTDAQSYGMLAELYQSMGEKQKALDTYNKILEIDPDNPYIHLSLADYYRTNGDKEKSVSELKLAFQNKELDIETKISILVSYYNLIDVHADLKDQAMQMCKLLIETHPSESRAHAVYGDFLNKDEQYAEALVEYRRAIKLGSDEFPVYSQILILDSQLKDWDTMIKDADETVALFPDQPFGYFLSALARMQKKNYTEAVSLLNSGVKMLVDNPTLEAQFYSSLGEAYHELKDAARSDEYYEKALKLDPEDANVLNNYSYFLSLRGEKLEKAEKMSKLSNELEPEQASYQDTYGWIMFKSGRYEEAKVWIERSLTSSTDSSATVLEHYGDVLYKLGDTVKAIEFWQKAKAAGEGGSELLDKKIQDKIFIE
jgi:tetratricopeptide (TPR) repeat protein